MNTVGFENYNFHDSFIKDVRYNQNKLIFLISNLQYQNSYINASVEFDIKNFDLNFIYLKRYPLLNNVFYKGRQLTYDKIKELFKRGFVLQIDELLVSMESKLFVFECSLYPYSERKGVSKILRIELNEFQQFSVNKIV